MDFAIFSPYIITLYPFGNSFDSLYIEIYIDFLIYTDNYLSFLK